MSRHLWVPRHEERTLPRLPAGVIGRHEDGGCGGLHRPDAVTQCDGQPLPCQQLPTHDASARAAGAVRLVAVRYRLPARWPRGSTTCR